MRIHWVPYEIYFTTTQINPVFYIYTLERSFCLIINIMINIRYISRCVMQIFKSVRFILHAVPSDYRFSSVQVKNLTPTASEKTRGPDVAASVSRLTCMRCHDNAQSDTPQSNTECRTDITIRARTVYTTNVTNIMDFSKIFTSCLLCVCEKPYCFLLSWRGTS